MTDLVRFTGCDEHQVRFGGCDDPNGLLNVGETYSVEHREIHTWHTKVVLRAFPTKWFNSVCFESAGTVEP